jgi:hypothetical protein
MIPSAPVICIKCHRELDLPGAVILSPPHESGGCFTSNLCHWCYTALLVWLGEGVNEASHNRIEY